MPPSPEKKRVAVVGSRTFNDKRRLYEVLTKNFDRIKLVISGGAKGADTLATEWATDFGIPYLVFPALWRDPFTGVYNRGAGFKRNRNIVEEADVVVAFWDGISAGTANTIEMAKQCKKDVRIIRFTPPPPPAEPDPKVRVAQAQMALAQARVEEMGSEPTDQTETPPEGCGPHCCTPEAMQDRHDFYEAQEQRFQEAAEAPVSTSKVPEIPFKEDLL